MVRFDHQKKRAQLLLKAHEILPILEEPEHQNPEYVFPRITNNESNMIVSLVNVQHSGDQNTQ